MKISAWHKSQGDIVEWWYPIFHYDKVYVSKVFGDEYSQISPMSINANEIIYGGTGFAITVEDGKEVFHKDKDKDLSFEIEHIYPDYSLYPEYTKDTAYGFLTRGCPNNCSYCSVSKKEGKCSHKVANLSEFWKGQKHIKLLDPNILACKDRIELLTQLKDSKANIDFTQGLDARFITKEIALLLKDIKKTNVHFAFDFMKNEKAIIKGLKIYADIVGLGARVGDKTVYMLTNYDTTHEQDLYRIQKIEECGFVPDVRIYRKNSAPQITRDLQRWCNNRLIYSSTKWQDYIPRKDGRTIKEIYY
ncbi:MAG: radical SAM protein [Clostridia bacterium]|nr:radical SAM protein [Clostridia bacterium]